MSAARWPGRRRASSLSARPGGGPVACCTFAPLEAATRRARDRDEPCAARPGECLRMIVMKFGGTSVAVPENFRVAVLLVVERRALDPVVVVSALSGVTNEIVELCRSADRRDDLAARIATRHVEHA